MATILRDSIFAVIVVIMCHDNRKKINSWVSFAFLYGYRAPVWQPLGAARAPLIKKKLDFFLFKKGHWSDLFWLGLVHGDNFYFSSPSLQATTS